MTQRIDPRVLAQVVPGEVIAGDGNGHGNGYGPLPPGFAPPAEIAPSSYLRFLPAIYAADEFVGRFLRIFEDVLDPVAVKIDDLPYYFDPMVAPPDLLNWMARWVDLAEGEDWPLPRRRA